MKAITTKFHGPTNSKGSRITASDEDGNRVTLSYAHELSGTENHDAAAKALCIKMDWTQHPLMRGDTKTGAVYVFAYAADTIEFTDEERATSRANREKRAKKVAQ